VFGTKRLLGRSFEDPNVQRNIRSWPFRVVDQEGKPMIQVQHGASSRSYVSLNTYWYREMTYQ
jgi:molecular chaperone DnaK (HSP70)